MTMVMVPLVMMIDGCNRCSYFCQASVLGLLSCPSPSLSICSIFHSILLSDLCMLLPLLLFLDIFFMYVCSMSLVSVFIVFFPLF